jgi:hypothetical protein
VEELVPEITELVALQLCKVVSEGVVNRLWRHLWTSFTMPQNIRKYRLRLYGMTTEHPPRNYLVQMYVDPDALLIAVSGSRITNLLDSYVRNLLYSIDTYLDPQCTCMPGPFGSLGEECEWHQNGCKRAVQVKAPSAPQVGGADGSN